MRTHHQYCLSSNATTTLESRDCLNVARCTTNSPPAKKQRTAIQPWRRMASALVETTPKAQQWWDAVHERGIYKALSTGDAAAYILDCDCSPAALEPSAYHLARQTAEGQSSVLSQLATFAYTATRREASASAAIILANFQKFLVISSCAVLYQSGSPREEVFNIVRICIGKAQDRYCQQTIRSVIWMNRLIDMLSSHGWGNRATDLLLICTCD